MIGQHAVTKGRLSLVELDEVYTFMFNPNEVTDSRSVSFPDQVVPGMSHPVTQYAGGSARIITFELYLDGDRGGLGRRLASVAPNERRPPRGRDLSGDSALADRGRASPTNPPSKSIQHDLDFLQSLTYPIQTEGIGLPDVHPPTVLFSFGEQYLGVECVVQSVNVRTNYWNPSLEPIRSTVGITLKQKVARSVARSVVYEARRG